MIIKIDIIDIIPMDRILNIFLIYFNLKIAEYPPPLDIDIFNFEFEVKTLFSTL